MLPIEGSAQAPAVEKAAGADKPKKPFTILLPVNRHEGHGPELLGLAVALAHSCDGEIVAVEVSTPYNERDPHQWQIEDEDVPDDIPFEFLRVEAETVPQGILQTARERECNLILLHWHGRPRALRHRLGHILDPIIEDAPCDVALLHGTVPTTSASEEPYRILVASAGGPHASVAARLAMLLAKTFSGTVTLATVVRTDATDEQEEAALQMLAATIEASGLTPEEAEVVVEPLVIHSDNVTEGLSEESRKHTIAFLGASNDGVFNQLLLGSLIERLAPDMPVPVVVVKGFGGFTQYWLRRFWRAVDTSLPSVTPQERLDTYKRVRRGARATHDFYILMFLSVVIASMGLLLDSGAVIIGAMLVAPLMTPMLGLGLGVVMGDVNLLRIAAKSTSLGVLLAIAVSALLGLATPLVIMTTEISGRIQPNLLDLTVGIAAGAAGAYSVSRKGVGAALPGVAIAAALVPPLAVTGITLSIGNWVAARGAALLFGTNLAAICFAGALTYMILGFVPHEKEEISRHALLRRGLFIFLLLLFVVSIPLSRTLARSTTEGILDRNLNQVLEQTLSEETNLALFSVDWDRDTAADEPLRVEVVLYAVTDVTPDMRDSIDSAISEATGREVLLRLIVIPISDLREPEATPDAPQEPAAP